MTPKPPNLCPFCFEVFSTSLLMAEHRTGNPRRCLAIEEIRQAGLNRDRLGVWKRLRR